MACLEIDKKVLAFYRLRFFKTFFKKLKVCSVAQKRPSLGRHFESLKKRLFMKLFYLR